MGKILDRIQKIASNEGITIGALERRIGASKGVLSRAINNGTDIQAKWLEVIVENYPLYSTRWLLTGKGEMLSNKANTATKETTSSSQEFLALLSAFQKKTDEVGMLKEEIGTLKERLNQLEREKGSSASGVQNSRTAIAG